MRNVSRKLFFCLPLAVMLGCTVNSSEDEFALESTVAGSANAQASGERCATMKVHEEKIKENPGLLKKMEEIEAYTQRFVQSQGKKSTQPGSGDVSTSTVDASTATIEIPVVVNVIYNTTQQNISDDQIRSQIEVLNRDFRATNTDINNVPTTFSTLKSDMNYHFTLKTIVRKQSSKASWGTRDAMKSTQKGGISPTSPTTNLNIWVCNIGGGILGYAQFPGGSSNTDGVVIGPEFFGNKAYMTSPSTAYLATPYDKGRTATHEIGHWMNLRHIWGDATCGSDLVNDTPTHNTANYGCPAPGHKSTCAGTPVEMTMDYMDYTDDACMYMFSSGQKTRSRAVFATGGPRSGYYAVQ